MAEVLLLDAMKEEVCAFEIVGAGLFSSGNGADGRAVLAMKEVGIDLGNYSSKRLIQEIVDGAVAIFCMTRSHLDSLRKMFRNLPKHCYLFREFVGNSDEDVVDPFCYDLEAYVRVRNSISEAIPSIVKFLKEELNDN
jgi:protein-tyrosine phosphatase